MLKVDLSDKELFGNDAGEDEKPEVLDSYFIDLKVFSDFYDSSTTLSVLSARKGMGKSALISRLAFKLEKEEATNKIIVIKTTGNALLGLGDFSGKDQVYLENYWKQIICKKINIEIGARIGFALSDNEISMVEASELEGLKNKNIVSSLISRIKGKIPSLELEIKKSFPENWEALLATYQESHKNTCIWLLIDDVDAKYIDNEIYQDKVGAFFSAVRSLANEVHNLNIRSTIRTDVWGNLRHLEDLDKWEQYIIDIDWTRKQMREMLAKRILSYIKRKHPSSDEAKLDYTRDYNTILYIIFKDMPWGKRQQKPFTPISVLSNNRPRWMGQLCRMSAKQAYQTKNNMVGIYQLNQVLNKFGQYRKNDLIKEHKHQFTDLDNLIDTLRAGAREYTLKQLRSLLTANYLSGKGNDKVPLIDGEIFSNVNQLGCLLYKIGLISVANRKIDETGFTHYNQDPDLFNSRRNEANELIWAIHPCYRSYLGIK